MAKGMLYFLYREKSDSALLTLNALLGVGTALAPLKLEVHAKLELEIQKSAT